MHLKVAVLIFAFISLEMMVDAELFFNRAHLTDAQINELGLKCIPGHTVIRIEQKQAIDGSGSEEETRRSHMNAEAKDETCQICVCSIEGKDEYCSQRPARNVNECIRMGILKKNMESNLPFKHERSLAFRIRRDYIWHYDEIPYEAKASCKRSTSYYSNNVDANNTVIDVPSDIDSLLDYSNKDICYYCVCSIDGRNAGCISRDPWYCEYYRIIREPDAARNKYHDLFQQDRPAYFRSLSYRLRRTMDEGMMDFMDVVGDENNDAKCIPFVSEYSDCTDANLCSGCNRCVCSAEAEWRCETVFDCAVDDEASTDRETISTALDVLYSELKNKAKKKTRNLVPPPPKPDDELIVPDVDRYEEDFATYLSRQKRSVRDKEENEKENFTIKFFHTTVDLNKDTLKDKNETGTIGANKVDIIHLPKISRRMNSVDNINKTDLNALHIDYNSRDYDHHITENNIESASQAEDLDILSKSKLHKLLGNYSQTIKNEDLTKLVVNELKSGTEVIGDKNVSPTSNITFTSENDTLTAMTFIAGNLLNKLWDMEKEYIDESEVETIKHKKINDLLELFKEPLSIRQETFLKNALLKLSDTLNKNNNIKNVSLCETIKDSDILVDDNFDEREHKINKNKTKCFTEKEKEKQIGRSEKDINTDVVFKLNNVIHLMKKFDQVQKNLKVLKQPAPNTQSGKTNVESSLTANEKSSINLFGSLLERITELLIPNNSSKKFTNKLQSLNQFSTKNNVKKALEERFKIDLSQNNMTIKDKIIFDYLNHVENNPDCLLNRLQKKKEESKINLEGNILYNLSEFFKIKSLIDLVKLTNSEPVSTVAMVSTTKDYREVQTDTESLRISASNPINNSSQKVNVTKEKLKNHVKAIIEDLLELQNENDVKSKSNINILDALPCIYNILNVDRINNDSMTMKKQIESDPLNKIKKLIDSMKLEFTTNAPTRRNNMMNTEKPKSVRVWERIIKNVDKQQKETRRNYNYKAPKSYEDLKISMDIAEAAGNSYKKFALLSEIPPNKRLMLLKTLEADTKQKTLVLKDIKDHLGILKTLSVDRRNEFEEFINNAERNLNLSVKVLQNMGPSKQINHERELVEVFDPNKFETNRQSINVPISSSIFDNYQNDFKLTRDQVLSRLIENRLKFYIASKEVTNADLNDDMNYNIAKKILYLLRQGNIDVAKELFKVFIANKREPIENRDNSASPITMDNVKSKGSMLLTLKEPLKLDESSKKIPVKTADLLFRQLLNVKNMSFK